MFGGAADDDDDDFSLAGGAPRTSNSKLSNLFGMGGAKDQPLVYTAPKQPRKNTGPTQDTQQSQSSEQKPLGVLQAAKVHCYKLVNSEFVPQGVVGAALLGNRETHKYQLLVYQSKQAPIGLKTINSAFRFEVLANQYARFYDDQNQFLSIRFDNQAALESFAKQVSLAIGDCSGANLSSVIIQDLLIGSGAEICDGDSAELKYTGWMFTNGTTGQVFDSNMETDKTFRLKLGKGKVIKGWEIGLIGLAVSGKR